MGNSISICKYISHEYTSNSELNKEQIDYIVAKYILLMDLDSCIKMQMNKQSYRTLMNQTIFKILNKMLDSYKIQQLYERIYGTSSESLLSVNEMYIKTSIFYTNIAYIYSIIYVRLHTLQIPSHKKEKTYNNFPEIIQFYKNTMYDLKVGGFTDLTTIAYNQYKEDLRDFYETFTLRDLTTEENVNKFGDIVLLDYCGSSLDDISCKVEEDGEKTKEYIGIDRHDMFKQYGSRLRLLMKHANTYTNELNQMKQDMLLMGDKAPISLLNDLFSEDPSEKCMRLNGEYTAELVDKILNRIKEIEYQYHVHYIDCLQLYEAIIENTIYHTVLEQLPILEDLYIRLNILD